MSISLTVGCLSTRISDELFAHEGDADLTETSLCVDPAEQFLSYEPVFWGTQSQSLLKQVCPGNVARA